MNAKNGLEAQLTYLPATNATVKNNHMALTTDSFAPGATDVTVAPAQIFLSQINTPTTLFSKGFKTSTGSTLKDLKGNTLVEWFSIRAQGMIMLNASDLEGDYQFALLSDDGSVMRIDRTGTGSSFETWINNDAVQANKLGCAAKTVHLKPNMLLPIQVRYFQGPRERISFSLLWRRNPTSLADEACGVMKGDNHYFTGEDSTPTENYTALLARGWKVVPSKNFYLSGDKVNPCVEVYGSNIPTEEEMLNKYGCGAKADKKVNICKKTGNNSYQQLCVALEGAVNGHQVPFDGGVGPTGNYFGKCK